MSHIPHPAIILLVPSAATGYLRRVDRPWPAPKPTRLPRWAPAPIPSFDRRALRERVTRLLRDNRAQRDGLKAAASWCYQ
jgi:hypothetical protein